MKITNTNLRKAIKHLKDTRHKAHELRYEHPTQYLREVELVDSKTHIQFIKALLIIERQRETRIFIRLLSIPVDTSGIKHVDISKDHFIDWNGIQKNISRVFEKSNRTSENRKMHHRKE